MRRFAPCLFALMVALTAPLVAQDAEESFYRGYYLQQRGELSAALEQYETALRQDADAKIEARILEQLDSISESVVAGDLARLVPQGTIAYIELTEPGEHIERLAKTMGLVGRQPSSEDRVLLPLDDGLVLPSDFQLSPALLAELKNVNGFAIAITGFNHEEEHPEGVVVIHAGDSNLIRGLMDTGVQVIPREESIGGCETFCIEDEIWFVKKGAIILASDSPDQIQMALNRFEGDVPSLAQDERFLQHQGERQDSMLFAYASGARLMKEIGPQLDDEAAIARVVLGLDRLQHVTATLGATDTGAAAQLRLKFEDGHPGLAYGLLKTEPLSDDLMDRIPAGSAVVAALGVNPQLIKMAHAKAPEHFSVLDIGRELFANIQNIGLFVLPSVAEYGDEVPNFGVVISAHDSERSEHIWNGLLSLPSQLEVEDGIKVKKIEIAGRAARRYTFPDDESPRIIVTRLDEKALLFGTEASVELACKTADGDHPSAASDSDLSELMSNRPEHTAKAVFVHAGRMLQLVGLIEGADGSDAVELRRASEALGKTRLAITSDEAPSALTLRVEADGLTPFEDIIKTIVAATGGEDWHVAANDE